MADAAKDASDVVALAEELAWAHGARSSEEARERALAVMTSATVALARANGIDEEAFDELVSSAWSEFGLELDALN